MRKTQIIKVNNSCGKRGCDIDEERIILPNDGKFSNVCSENFRAGNVTTKVLYMAQLAMDAAQTEEQIEILEDVSAGIGSLHLL